MTGSQHSRFFIRREKIQNKPHYTTKKISSTGGRIRFACFSAGVIVLQIRGELGKRTVRVLLPRKKGAWHEAQKTALRHNTPIIIHQSETTLTRYPSERRPVYRYPLQVGRFVRMAHAVFPRRIKNTAPPQAADFNPAADTKHHQYR